MIELVEIEIRCGVIPKYNILLIPKTDTCYLNNKKYQTSKTFTNKVINLIENLEEKSIKKSSIDDEEYFIRIIKDNKEKKLHGRGEYPSNYKLLISLFEELQYE